MATGRRGEKSKPITEKECQLADDLWRALSVESGAENPRLLVDAELVRVNDDGSWALTAKGYTLIDRVHSEDYRLWQVARSGRCNYDRFEATTLKRDLRRELAVTCLTGRCGYCGYTSHRPDLDKPTKLRFACPKCGKNEFVVYEAQYGS